MKTLITSISLAVILNYQIPSYAVQPANNANTIFKCKTEKGAFTYQEQPCSNKSSTLSSWKPRIKKNTPLSLSMKISASGTYMTRGSANSIPLVFYIDTGATHVSIPQEIADKAGMVCGKQFHAETANGVTMLCESIIDNMTFGVFKIQNVKAMIMPNLKKPLLGMNVLNKFHIEQVKGTMKITDKY